MFFGGFKPQKCILYILIIYTYILYEELLGTFFVKPAAILLCPEYLIFTTLDYL